MIPVAVAARVVIPLTDYSFYGILELWDGTSNTSMRSRNGGTAMEATEAR